MIRILVPTILLAILSAGPATAGQTGGLRAECRILGEPAVLELGFEAIASHGITWGPGPNPDITGVIGDGATTVYWNGTLSSSRGTVAIGGENFFLRFYDPNVYNRETVLEVTLTGKQTFTLEDVFGNYPGKHPCRIVRSW